MASSQVRHATLNTDHPLQLFALKQIGPTGANGDVVVVATAVLKVVNNMPTVALKRL
jgi:hypothetical protein